MNWEEWVNRGELKPLATGPEQSERLLESALEELRASENVLGIGLCAVSRDLSYEAMLKSGMALILHHGYRPESGQHHVITIKVISELLGREHRGLMKAFNDLRKERRGRLYEGIDECTEDEAREAIARAKELIELVQDQMSS